MPQYRFEEIAINSTEKKKPVEADKDTYLGLEHLDTGCLHVTRWGSEVAPIGDKLIMRKGDVLFGRRRAYQKKVAIAPFDGIFSAHGMVLRPRTEVITERFFPFFISSDYFLDAAINISVGSLSPTINWRDLKELTFNIPPLDEQDALADELWAFEDTKEAYNRLMAATDALVKSQFIEMFDAFIDDQRSWRTFGESFTYISRGKSPSYIDVSEIAVVNQACVYWESFNWDNLKYNLSYDVPIDRMLRNGDVLINSTGTGTLGRCNVFAPHRKDLIYVADGHITVLRPSDCLIPLYVKHYIMMESTQKEIFCNYVSGSTNQIELAKERLKALGIPIPPLALQTRFAEFVESTDKSKFALQHNIERLEMCRNALMQKAFS